MIRWYPKVVNRDNKNHELIIDSENGESVLSCYSAAVFEIVAPLLALDAGDDCQLTVRGTV